MKDAEKKETMLHGLKIENHYESDTSVIIKILYAMYLRLCALEASRPSPVTGIDLLRRLEDGR